MRTLYQVDAFTRTPFTGNPAGVVLDADGMTEDQMRAVARELNNSETAFVLRPERPGVDVHVRFFTPTTEVPTCGHATIATHFARAAEYGLPAGSLVQSTGGGLLQRVEIIRDGDRVRIGMHQGRATFGTELDRGQIGRLLAALGTDTEAFTSQGPVQIVSTGHAKVIVELRDRATVDGLRPDPHTLTDLSHELGCNGYFVFTRDTGDPHILTHARMFAPAIGIAEDPVTGNGHGPLGAYLVRYGMASSTGGGFSFTGRQGVALGRPGTVDVLVREKDSELLVSIAGSATTAFRAELHL